MTLDITPALIPHEDFHKGSWLLPVKRKGWYYFQHRKNENNVRNRQFLRSVDAPLRKLVAWLHKRGIKTTPSCAGHVLPFEQIEQIYEGLEEDAEDITGAGLLLEDIETGKIICFQDSSYALPWNRDEFISCLSEYQKRGVIGLHLGNKGSRAIHSRLLSVFHRQKNDRIEFREKDSILFIFTRGNSYRKIRHAWNRIHRSLKKALH